MDLSEYIVDQLGGDLPSPGVRNVAVTCIACGREKKFYVNVESGLAQCWVCGYKANLEKIIADVEGLPLPQAIAKAVALLHGRARTKIRERISDTTISNIVRDLLSDEKAVKQDAQQLALPKYSIPIQDQRAKPARTYLSVTRKISEKKTKRYRLHYVYAPDPEAPQYHRHIVFPEYDDDGVLLYYTTRATFEPEWGPKSYHPRGHKDTLYGFHKVRNNLDGVILVEGPMDVMALSGYAVALLGKAITQQQRAQLCRRFKRVWVCLDKEEQLASWELAKDLNGHGLDTYVVTTPGKDAAESGLIPTASLVSRILSTARAYSASSHLKLKLQHSH